MAKRFTDTDMWEDDWFYELSPEYKLFWFYVKDNCDHAGIWKPKLKAFKAVSDIDIDLEKALTYFNNGKIRVRILFNGKWYLEDFFVFQYGTVMNLKNRVHKSVLELMQDNYILPDSVRNLKKVVVKNGDKEEDMSPLEFQSTWML